MKTQFYKKDTTNTQLQYIKKDMIKYNKKGKNMDINEKIKIIEDMQAVVEQMRLDDIEEDPSLEDEVFECSCCGKTKCLAGSIQYGKYRLCNDCVLLAETGFAIGKFKNADELIKAMEDTRLEEMCEFIKLEEKREIN